jgi:hypothetical protein
MFSVQYSKSSFLHIKWNKIQLWKLVCFIMQLKWDPTTKYPNIVWEKKLVLQWKYHKLCIISLYIMTFVCNHFLHNIYFSFSCSFPFCFSLLVFPTLQWHIHIICSREIHMHGKTNISRYVAPPHTFQSTFKKTNNIGW